MAITRAEIQFVLREKGLSDNLRKMITKQRRTPDNPPTITYTGLKWQVTRDEVFYSQKVIGNLADLPDQPRGLERATIDHVVILAKYQGTLPPGQYSGILYGYPEVQITVGHGGSVTATGTSLRSAHTCLKKVIREATTQPPTAS